MRIAMLRYEMWRLSNVMDEERSGLEDMMRWSIEYGLSIFPSCDEKQEKAVTDKAWDEHPIEVGLPECLS